MGRGPKDIHAMEVSRVSVVQTDIGSVVPTDTGCHNRGKRIGVFFQCSMTIPWASPCIPHSVPYNTYSRRMTRRRTAWPCQGVR
jgi:hypothetical protein